MKKINMNDLETEITSRLQEYAEVTGDKVKEAARDTAKECVKDIRSKSPSKSGEYRRGWKRKTMFENADEIRISIYNANKPQITHLLEYGHIVRNRPGGKVLGVAGAHVHIRPAEIKAKKDFEKRIKKAVRQ